MCIRNFGARFLSLHLNIRQQNLFLDTVDPTDPADTIAVDATAAGPGGEKKPVVVTQTVTVAPSDDPELGSVTPTEEIEVNPDGNVIYTTVYITPTPSESVDLDPVVITMTITDSVTAPLEVDTMVTTVQVM